MQVSTSFSEKLRVSHFCSLHFLRTSAFLPLMVMTTSVLMAQASQAQISQQTSQVTSQLPDNPSISVLQEGQTDIQLASSLQQSTPQSPLQTPSTAQPSPTNPMPMDTPVPVHPSHYMTLNERFRLQAHTTFSPEAIVLPAAEAGITMAHPARRFPRDWSDGGAAFARNYGSTAGGRTVGGLTDFGVAWLDHEDPRYFRSLDHRVTHRISHAIFFTFFDRMNSGQRTFAVSNFAAASASGFICNLWQPDGFNDIAHGLQRSERGFAAITTANIIAEFSPDLSKLMHKAHLPDGVANSILPRSF